jgi:membrane-associated protease RseP (regulator of RpoE activity)
LPAHARDQLVDYEGPAKGLALQTSTGFTITGWQDTTREDPRSRVVNVEKDSPAARAGLLPGDRIVKVNGRPNDIVLKISGPPAQVKAAVESLRKSEIPVDEVDIGEDTTKAVARAHFVEYARFAERLKALRADGYVEAQLVPSDTLDTLVRDWPRGKSSLALTVQRGNEVIDLPPFSPRTAGLYPTQLYETLSMILLILLLLAYYPYRRHDGQLMVLCMMGYSVHRFINESLRIEPTVGMGLTLSQWGSVVIFAAAVAIELYLWRAMPSRWSETPPAAPAPEAPKAN